MLGFRLGFDINSLETYYGFHQFLATSMVWWSEFLATDTEILGSIPGATRFSEK
jgi:hypothetical protein